MYLLIATDKNTKQVLRFTGSLSDVCTLLERLDYSGNYTFAVSRI